MLSSTETTVETIWAELLQLDKINPEDNFFELGGDSLTTLEMLFRTGDAFGVEIRPGDIINAPTLREFCQFIDMNKSGVPPVSDKTQDEAFEEIVPCARKENMPVSFIQEQIVGAELAGLYDPSKTRSHCLALCYRIEGVIDTSALDKALCEIVRRHETLRTSYGVEDGTIFQKVNEAPEAMLCEVDLSNLGQDGRKGVIDCVLHRMANYSFSYFNDKLMISAILITDAAQEHILVIIVNHVAIDGLSMTMFRNELFLLYNAFTLDEQSPLADPPIQYADYAVWEREHFSGGRLESKLAYWRQISREPLSAALPVDHTPETISYAGDIVPVTILPELTAQMQQLARKRKVTLFTVLFAAFITLIHAFSGYRYNIFCMPVANRSRRETRSLIGCLMNFQFVYIDLSDNPTFLELIERLNRTLHDVYDNYVPFHLISQQISPQGPVVDFQLMTAPDETAYPEGLSFFPLKLQPHEFALFPIDVYLLGSSEAITGHFKYQTAKYDRQTIMDMVSDYMCLLERMTREPDIRLSDMGIKPHNSVVQ